MSSHPVLEEALSAQISGLYAAPIIPLNALGEPDPDAFDRVIDFLLDRGAEGICIGGATSEYPHFDLVERRALITSAALRTRGRGVLIAAVGSSSLRGVLALARHALNAGARALLLPAPHFFRYDQSDLEAFCREVCRSCPAPYLIYNLPGFTTGFELGTTIRLFRDEPGIVGLKDSSGDSAAIRPLAESRGRRELSLFAGSDHLIYEALTAGWNGAISGNINLCPELYASLFRSFRNGNLETARKCQEAISALGDRARALPFPWAVRIGLELRGIRVGPLPLPVSPSRSAQISDFKRWFERWLQTELPEIAKART
jgi:4-hydroxy-tetrahydrodipicolinate synthase